MSDLGLGSRFGTKAEALLGEILLSRAENDVVRPSGTDVITEQTGCRLMHAALWMTANNKIT